MAPFRCPAQILLVLSLCCFQGLETIDAFSFSPSTRASKSFFSIPSVTPFSRHDARLVQVYRQRLPLSTTASSSDGVNEVRDDSSGILPASIAVGAITALMGYIYGKILSGSVVRYIISFVYIMLVCFHSFLNGS